MQMQALITKQPRAATITAECGEDGSPCCVLKMSRFAPSLTDIMRLLGGTLNVHRCQCHTVRLVAFDRVEFMLLVGKADTILQRNAAMYKQKSRNAKNEDQ